MHSLQFTEQQVKQMLTHPQADANFEILYPRYVWQPEFEGGPLEIVNEGFNSLVIGGHGVMNPYALKLVTQPALIPEVHCEVKAYDQLAATAVRTPSLLGSYVTPDQQPLTIDLGTGHFSKSENVFK